MFSITLKSASCMYKNCYKNSTKTLQRIYFTMEKSLYQLFSKSYDDYKNEMQFIWIFYIFMYKLFKFFCSCKLTICAESNSLWMERGENTQNLFRFSQKCSKLSFMVSLFRKPYYTFAKVDKCFKNCQQINCNLIVFRKIEKTNSIDLIKILYQVLHVKTNLLSRIEA